MPRPADLFRPLADLDPGILFLALSDARPSTIALVLSYLPESLAAQVAGKMSSDLRQRVLCCLATNEPSDIDAIQIVAQSVCDRVQHVQTAGPVVAVRILAECDCETQAELFQQLKRDQPAWGDLIQRSMPTFADISWLSDPELRSLIKNVELEVWAVALLDCRGPLVARIQSFLSEKGRRRLEDEMDYRRLAATEDRRRAQHRIAVTVPQIRQPGRRKIA